MLLTKEYPATHSMSTCWYFVDKDNNIAILDILDNGPVPVQALDTDESINSLCFDVPVKNMGDMKMLNFTEEQVELMFRGLWTKEVEDDHWWYDDAFKVDPSREKEFMDYLAGQRKTVTEEWDDRFQPVCLSRKQGIYMVDIDEDKKGMRNPHAKYLFESGIVLFRCDIPRYDDFDDHWEDFTKYFAEGSCPYYLYEGDYLASKLQKRVTVPKHPVKLSQMPKHTRDKITRLDLRFSESEAIQIAAQTPCYQTIYHNDYPSDNGYYYAEAIMSSGEKVLVLNAEDKNVPPDIPLVRPLLKPKYDD